jgi:hypothetical protein
LRRFGKVWRELRRTEMSRKEIFYLFVGCMSLVVIDWLKNRVLNESLDE